MDYARFIRFERKQKGDITPLLGDRKTFNQAVKDLIEPFSSKQIDKIACLEARGFIFAGAIAYLLNAGVVMVRKGGALPCDVLSEEFVDYTRQRKSLEIAKDAIKKGDRVLIVDDWVETGAQAKASVSMIEQLGGIIVGFAVLVDDASEETYQFLSKYDYHFLITSHPDRKQ